MTGPEVMVDDARLQTDMRPQPLNIVHIMGSIDDDAAGPSYSVPRLCQSLAELDHTVSLLSGTVNCDGRQLQRDGFEDCRYPLNGSLPNIGKLGLSSALRRGVFTAAARADVLHTHGLWRFANIYPATAARRLSRPLILSPRGMLAPNALGFSAWSKRVFWALRQRSAVHSVAALHATSEQEYEDIRAYGLKQPVVVIPNGVDLPVLDSVDRSENETPMVLFLGRLHPVKAISRLLKAWHLLGEVQSGWRLVVVGPSEQEHDQELVGLVAELKLKNVEVRKPVRQSEKWNLLQRAELMVLPSFSENFGIAVAESLVAETPVIASRGAPWQGLETHACGWWVDNAPESLAEALATALNLSSDQRTAMGRRGREWMALDFSWPGIAAQMTGVYRWLRHGGVPPACVRFE